MMRVVLAIAMLLAGIGGADARASRAGGGGYGMWVRGYYRSNGTYVQRYHRARPGLGSRYAYRGVSAASWSFTQSPAYGTASFYNRRAQANILDAQSGGTESEFQAAGAPTEARDGPDDDSGPARCDDGVRVGVGGTFCMLN